MPNAKRKPTVPEKNYAEFIEIFRPVIATGW